LLLASAVVHSVVDLHPSHTQRFALQA
jgi:hypothetical protein